MLSQQANNQNLTIPYSTLQNFEKLLQTQDELNDALQKQTIRQPNELTSQPQDPSHPTEHLESQMNDTDTQIENLLEENDTIWHLIDQNEIEYLLDQFEATHNPLKANPD